jgi:beta-lactamase superfamily II metal-dependent hydrolase
MIKKQTLLKALPALFFVLIFGLFPALTEKGNASSQGKLNYYAFDIGQGDSELIITPHEHQILVDGGPDNRVIEKLAQVMPKGDTSLDAIILSHPHADHLTGLVEVLKRYEVGAVYASGVLHTSDAYLAFLAELKKKNLKITDVSKAENLVFDDGVSINWLAPKTSYAGMKLKNIHDSMVVLRVVYKNDALILTGDLETDLENKLISSKVELKSQILKVGHHGSKTSTSREFLEAMKPQFATISVGQGNDYGHPHSLILERLDRKSVV